MLDSPESRLLVRARLGEDLEPVVEDQINFYTDYFFNFLRPSYRWDLPACEAKDFWITIALGYLYSYDREARKEHCDK